MIKDRRQKILCDKAPLRFGEPLKHSTTVGAHEFPELKARIHELKLSSPAFMRLYKEYQALDDEIHRIEQDIETTSDAYAEQLKFKRVRLTAHLHGVLTGRIALHDAAEE